MSVAELKYANCVVTLNVHILMHRGYPRPYSAYAWCRIPWDVEMGRISLTKTYRIVPPLATAAVDVSVGSSRR
jgi:hypothetical protein